MHAEWEERQVETWTIYAGCAAQDQANSGLQQASQHRTLLERCLVGTMLLKYSFGMRGRWKDLDPFGNWRLKARIAGLQSNSRLLS